MDPAPPPTPMSDAFAELGELYARVDAEVAAANPRCELSGRCCDFETSGHRLLSSGLETAYAVAAAGGAVPEAGSGRCPWHVDGLCKLRDGRPLGCRIYFCDPSWADTMPDVYERHHAGIRALHERHGLLYSYATFVDAVR